jgi:hypothetical protein
MTQNVRISLCVNKPNKAEEGQENTHTHPKSFNHYVSRRHHSLVVTLIGIRIMVCWDLYVVAYHPLQQM